MTTKKRLLISFSPAEWADWDLARGDVPLATWIARAANEAANNPESLVNYRDDYRQGERQGGGKYGRYHLVSQSAVKTQRRKAGK